MSAEATGGAGPSPSEMERLWDLARRKGMLSSGAYAAGLARIRESAAAGHDVLSALVEAGMPRDQAEELQAVHADSGPVGIPLDVPAEPEPVRVGKYRLLDSLGVGGMGAVYRAEDEQLGRRVALKVLKGGCEFASDESADRFQQEAMSLARLDHPNIVRVYEAGRADGQAYLALELVDGGSLSARDYGALPIPNKIAIGRDVARALQHAHDHGLVHRDVKPSNVLLRADGSAVLGDFGLVRDVSSKLRMTMSFAWLGTPAYMSPEQASGRTAAIDFRTDIYSLGVLLYELFAGDLPFRADDFEELRRQITERAAPPLRSRARGLPAEVEAVVMKAMEKRPQERYPSANAFAEDLDRLLRSEPPSVRPPTILRRWWGRARRRPVVLIVTGALVFAISAAGAVVLGPRSPSAEARRDQAVAALDSALQARTERLEAAARALIQHRVRAILEECSSMPGRLPEREMVQHLASQFATTDVETDLIVVEDMHGRVIWKSRAEGDVAIPGGEGGSSIRPTQDGVWLLHRREVASPSREDVRVGWVVLGLRVDDAWYREALVAARAALAWRPIGEHAVAGGGEDAPDLARHLDDAGSRPVDRLATASREYRIYEVRRGDCARVVAVEDPRWRHAARAASIACALAGVVLAGLGGVAWLCR